MFTKYHWVGGALGMAAYCGFSHLILGILEDLEVSKVLPDDKLPKIIPQSVIQAIILNINIERLLYRKWIHFTISRN